MPEDRLDAAAHIRLLPQGLSADKRNRPCVCGFQALPWRPPRGEIVLARRRIQYGKLAIGAAPWAGMVALGALLIRSRMKPKPGLSKQEVAPPEHFEQLEPGRGRMAPAPRHIPLIGWRDVIWRTWREVGADRLTTVAASVTFFSLLSIFPALGVFVSLYGLVADVSQVSKQLDQMASVLPAPVLSILGDQMVRLTTGEPAGLSVAFVVSLLLAVWTANGAMKALFDGLNVAYDEVEKRNFFTKTMWTYGFTFALLIFLALTTAILVAAPVVLEALGLADSWMTPARWLAMFVVGYRYAPCRARARWRWVVPGAAWAAGFWLVGSLGFSWYLNNVAHYDATYGSLGAVIGFMMWIWVSVMIVLVGAELNAEIEHQTALDSTTGPPQPMGVRGAAMADTVGLKFIGLREGAGILWGDARRLLHRPPKPPTS
jgi:membrane protein